MKDLPKDYNHDEAPLSTSPAMPDVVYESHHIIKPTSATHATCSDIELRIQDRVRLVFRPEIVVNDSNPDANIKGTFVYQKLSKGSSWEDDERKSLNFLKGGEGFQLELHSEELLTLRRELHSLANDVRKNGHPTGARQVVRRPREITQLIADLSHFLGESPDRGSQVLKPILNWLTKNPLAATALANTEQFPSLNALLELANLKALFKTWKENQNNGDEEFWQNTFNTHHVILSQLFDYPITILQQKAYLGGKTLSNKHGKVVDFVYSNSLTASIGLIEIKTPTAPLLGGSYRDNVYPLDKELVGAMSQALAYRETATDDFKIIKAEHSAALSGEIGVVVVSGNCGELSDEHRKRSFERFRNRLVGVRLVTYDELFARVERLIALLESTPQRREAVTPPSDQDSGHPA